MIQIKVEYSANLIYDSAGPLFEIQNFCYNFTPANIVSEFIRDATCVVLHGLNVFGLLFFVLFCSSFCSKMAKRCVFFVFLSHVFLSFLLVVHALFWVVNPLSTTLGGACGHFVAPFVVLASKLQLYSNCTTIAQHFGGKKVVSFLFFLVRLHFLMVFPMRNLTS